ncbi:MAG: heavy metal-binding domain-containing protein [Armatimonadota bacterium]
MYSYTCPMHPEVAQDRPGNCPECGMFLTADTDDDVEYYCPMHPDVVQEDPGRCPDCGMFLEARTISKAG